MSIYQINVFTQRIVNLFLQNLFSRPRGIPVYLFIAFCGPLLAPKRYQQKLDFYGSIEILFIVYFATLKQNSPFTMIK